MVNKIKLRFLVGSLAGTLLAASSSGAEFRAARSVHLQYAGENGDLFYNEVTVEQSTAGSYFMACGWNTGYFGLQQLDQSTNKIIIFSVWDPTRGDEANKVPLEQRVQVPFQNPEAKVTRFGGEGTGGKCVWPFAWQTNQTYRFAVVANVAGEQTSYAGWFYDAHAAEWKHLVTFATRAHGQYLRGLYSFVEDFRRDGKSVNETRRARFGNGWLRNIDKKWLPLDHAVFTASNAEWESKTNIDAGIFGDAFYLATGGGISQSLELNGQVTLPNAERQYPQLPEFIETPSPKK